MRKSTNIKTLFTNKVATPHDQVALTAYVNGDIEPDVDPNYLRLYSNPQNRMHYFLIKLTDLSSPNIEQWTDDERKSAGFAANPMYRIQLPLGAKVISVSLRVETLGETIEPPTGHLHTEGECRSTSGCSTGCCSTGTDGKCYCNYCCIGFKGRSIEAGRNQKGCSCQKESNQKAFSCRSKPSSGCAWYETEQCNSNGCYCCT